MKIVLTTTFLVGVLAIGFLGISNGNSNIDNVFAQGDGGMMGNDTGGMTMNATLAFAQGEENVTMSMGNDTSMTMNATLPMSIIGNDTAKKP
jgi:hypothetical protein